MLARFIRPFRRLVCLALTVAWSSLVDIDYAMQISWLPSLSRYTVATPNPSLLHQNQSQILPHGPHMDRLFEKELSDTRLDKSLDGKLDSWQNWIASWKKTRATVLAKCVHTLRQIRGDSVEKRQASGSTLSSRWTLEKEPLFFVSWRQAILSTTFMLSLQSR